MRSASLEIEESELSLHGQVQPSSPSGEDRNSQLATHQRYETAAQHAARDAEVLNLSKRRCNPQALQARRPGDRGRMACLVARRMAEQGGNDGLIDVGASELDAAI
jgi:hypothetical protein